MKTQVECMFADCIYQLSHRVNAKRSIAGPAKVRPKRTMVGKCRTAWTNFGRLIERDRKRRIGKWRTTFFRKSEGGK